MTRPHVFIDSDHARLKSYGSVSRGRKSIVKIELEMSSPYALGYLLEQLAQFDQQQPSAVPRPSSRGPMLLPPPGGHP